MKKWWLSPLAGLLVAGVCPSQDPASRPESRPLTPKEKIEAIDAEMEKARDDFFKLYRDTKSDEDKDKLFAEKYPKPETYVPRVLAIAREDAKGEGAELAYVWIVTNDRGGKNVDDAVVALLRDHVASKRLTDVADTLAYSRSAKTAALLKELEDKSPHKDVKGRALYAAAQYKRNLARTAEWLREQTESSEAVKRVEAEFQSEELARLRALDPAAVEKEIESILLRVKESYGDVEAGYGGTLAERADGDLFEIRNLAIGKVAPEIEGEDMFGKPLKLSDHKGKVIVIDFWGNW
jgi:hypothetical protein